MTHAKTEGCSRHKNIAEEGVIKCLVGDELLWESLREEMTLEQGYNG